MDGKPLYEYARRNQPLPRPIDPRICTIHQLELISWKNGKQHSWKTPVNELTEQEKEETVKLEKLVQEASTGASDDSLALSTANDSTDAQLDIDTVEGIEEGILALPAITFTIAYILIITLTMQTIAGQRRLRSR